VAAAAAIANGAGSMAPLGIMGSIVNQARMIPQPPPPKPHQWSIQPGETVWRVDCDGERNRALIKTAVFGDDGRLRFYTIRDLTLWDTEAAGGDEKVKPHLLNRCKPILSDQEPIRVPGEHVWIYDDEGYKQQGVIVRSYTSLMEGTRYKVKYGNKLDKEWQGSAHMVAYSPKINTPPPSPTYSEVEQRMELGEISENNNNKDDNNNNNNNKSAEYNTAYDSLIADGHSEEDAKEMLEAAMEEEEEGAILPIILARSNGGGGRKQFCALCFCNVFHCHTKDTKVVI
jgi:hypothetical protein